MRGGNIRHDRGLDGERVDALHKVPRRPDLERYPGETNRDALRRISGIALAAEHDRDEAKAAIERVRARHSIAPYAPEHDPYCGECGHDAGWPCPTRADLDGPGAAG